MVSDSDMHDPSDDTDNTGSGTAETDTSDQLADLDSDMTRTRGIECLVAANYQAFDDVVDVEATKLHDTSRSRLREALGHMVDHGLADAAEQHNISTETLIAVRDACRDAAQKQYPHHF